MLVHLKFENGLLVTQSVFLPVFASARLPSFLPAYLPVCLFLSVCLSARLTEVNSGSFFCLLPDL